jgi:hypothetical protein
MYEATFGLVSMQVCLRDSRTLSVAKIVVSVIDECMRKERWCNESDWGKSEYRKPKYSEKELNQCH